MSAMSINHAKKVEMPSFIIIFLFIGGVSNKPVSTMSHQIIIAVDIGKSMKGYMR